MKWKHSKSRAIRHHTHEKNKIKTMKYTEDHYSKKHSTHNVNFQTKTNFKIPEGVRKFTCHIWFHYWIWHEQCWTQNTEHWIYFFIELRFDVWDGNVYINNNEFELWKAKKLALASVKIDSFTILMNALRNNSNRFNQ